jgi:hypothetical protein
MSSYSEGSGDSCLSKSDKLAHRMRRTRGRKFDSQDQRLSATGSGIDGKHLVSSQITATDGRADATALLAATLHG